MRNGTGARSKKPNIRTLASPCLSPQNERWSAWTYNRVGYGSLLNFDDATYRKLLDAKRRPLALSQESLVHVESMAVTGGALLVIRPASLGIALDVWAARRREYLETELQKYGAILFRDFGLDSSADFERALKGVVGELLEYRERSSPRRQVLDRIYTSTDYPADQRIFFHNENSYQNRWPL